MNYKVEIQFNDDEKFLFRCIGENAEADFIKVIERIIESSIEYTLAEIVKTLQGGEIN